MEEHASGVPSEEEDKEEEEEEEEKEDMDVQESHGLSRDDLCQSMELVLARLEELANRLEACANEPQVRATAPQLDQKIVRQQIAYHVFTKYPKASVIKVA